MVLDYKIDVTLNGRAQICAFFAGDFEAEWTEAAKYASRHFRAEFVPDCDVVIANNHFKPADASCSFTPEALDSLKEGGSFIMLFLLKKRQRSGLGPFL